MLSSRFTVFLGASGAANLADGIYAVAMPLLAVQLTDSPVEVAGVTLAMTLPWALLGLHAGVLADRLDRRRVILTAHTIRWLALGLAAAAWISGWLDIRLLYALALTLGVTETLADTAAAAMPPALVDRDDLGRANSQLTGVATVTNAFVGPALAGLLVAASAPLALGGSALLYASAALGIAIIAGTFRAERRAASGIWHDSIEGIGYLWRHPVLRPLTIGTAAMNLLWGGWMATFVVFAVAPGPLGLDAAGYGLMATGFGVGGVLGSLLAVRLERRVGLRAALTVDVIGTFGMFLLPLSGIPLVAAAAIVLAGFGSATWIILNATLRQSIVPDELMARTYGAHRLLSWGALPVGAALAGLVAELAGVRVLFGAGAVLAALVLIGWLAWARDQRFVAMAAA